MEENVGTTDKIIRFIIGSIIIAVGLYFQSWFGMLGILLIGTALFGKCLLYYPFGLTTKRDKSHAQ